MALFIDEIVDTFTNQYVGNTYQIVLIDDSTRSSYSFTANATTNVITATGHNYVNGTRLNVLLASGTALPAPLAANTDYYAIDCATNTLKLSLTDGGAAIDITDTGTGTFLITDIALSYKIRGNIAGFVRQEIANYQGQTTRPTATITNPPVVGDTTVTVSGLGVCDNSAGTSDITFTAIAVIKGGTTARGNTTGDGVTYSPQASPQVVAAGQAKSIPFNISHTLPTE
jgi:hypothetical protein